MTVQKGFTLTLGALEISSAQTMIAGSARILYVVIFSATMGFSIAIGTNLYTLLDKSVESKIADFQCAHVHHPSGPWWQQKVNTWLSKMKNWQLILTN